MSLARRAAHLSAPPTRFLLEIWVPAADDPWTIVAWHFIQYAGNSDDGYEIVAWFEAEV